MDKKTAKWFMFALLIIILIAIIAARFSNTPAITKADSNPVYEQQRDLSTPSSRLIGHWVGVGGPDTDRLYYQPIGHSLDYGTFTWILKSSIVAKFKILSESRSGNYLKTREFFLLDNCMDGATAEYCISKDGLSMSKDMFYEDGKYDYFEYYYVDSRTQP
jgi:hypothetical protein